MPPLFLRGVPTQEQECQNAPPTGAITGYLKVFAAKYIVKKKKKKWTINKVVK